MIDVAKLKEWAATFEAADMGVLAQEVREEIATLERMERIDGSIAKRLSENISHNIELRAGLERIKNGNLPAGVSLQEFCTQLLNRRVSPNV